MLDTNIVSELMKTRADENVLTWLKSVQLEELYLSTLSVAEMSRGIEKLTSDAKQKRLRQALAAIRRTFGGRILEFDYASAAQFGRLSARNERQGLPMHPFDALLLAVAERHNFEMVTRNTKHFVGRTALNLLNPFEITSSP